ncbi:MAG: ABC transporter ATP-binding protein [Proteobacteria bacterium]|nr:ABC transporter ATP-binding protein [Pseudomonadota bacterium]
MLLKIKKITKIYKNKTGSIKALDNFTYSFESGYIYGIVGLNGAGKTTLIKTICGLLIPDNGNVYFNDDPLYPKGQKNLHLIGAILEGSRNIFWNFTPLQNVRYFALLRGLNLKDALSKALTIFNEFDLSDKLNTPVRNLSQGMKQKIAIAISLLHEPEILLLDEPTLGLDPIAGNRMQSYILKFARESKKIIIITSHQLSVLENICDEIIFLKKGTFVSSHSMADLKSNTQKTIYKIRALNSNYKNIEPIKQKFINVVTNRDFIEFDFIPNDFPLERALEMIKETGLSIIDIEKFKPTLEDLFFEEIGT